MAGPSLLDYFDIFAEREKQHNLKVVKEFVEKQSTDGCHIHVTVFKTGDTYVLSRPNEQQDQWITFFGRKNFGNTEDMVNKLAKDWSAYLILVCPKMGEYNDHPILGLPLSTEESFLYVEYTKAMNVFIGRKASCEPLVIAEDTETLEPLLYFLKCRLSTLLEEFTGKVGGLGWKGVACNRRKTLLEDALKNSTMYFNMVQDACQEMDEYLTHVAPVLYGKLQSQQKTLVLL